MGFGWQPIYEMENNPNVPNHQPEQVFFWRLAHQGSSNTHEGQDGAHHQSQEPTSERGQKNARSTPGWKIAPRIGSVVYTTQISTLW